MKSLKYSLFLSVASVCMFSSTLVAADVAPAVPLLAVPVSNTEVSAMAPAGKKQKLTPEEIAKLKADGQARKAAEALAKQNSQVDTTVSDAPMVHNLFEPEAPKGLVVANAGVQPLVPAHEAVPVPAAPLPAGQLVVPAHEAAPLPALVSAVQPLVPAHEAAPVPALVSVVQPLVPAHEAVPVPAGQLVVPAHEAAPLPAGQLVAPIAADLEAAKEKAVAEVVAAPPPANDARQMVEALVKKELAAKNDPNSPAVSAVAVEQLPVNGNVVSDAPIVAKPVKAKLSDEQALAYGSAKAKRLAKAKQDAGGELTEQEKALVSQDLTPEELSALEAVAKIKADKKAAQAVRAADAANAPAVSVKANKYGLTPAQISALQAKKRGDDLTQEQTIEYEAALAAKAATSAA